MQSTLMQVTSSKTEKMFSNANKNQHYLTLIVLFLWSLALIVVVSQANIIDEGFNNRQAAPALVVIESPNETVRLLEGLIKSIVYTSVTPQDVGLMTQKRGLDLGINRGFSGSQAGKHLMGLSAASFAGGPGK